MHNVDQYCAIHTLKVHSCILHGGLVNFCHSIKFLHLENIPLCRLTSHLKVECQSVGECTRSDGGERDFCDLSWNQGREDILIMCYKNTVIAEVAMHCVWIQYGTSRVFTILDKL